MEARPRSADHAGQAAVRDTLAARSWVGVVEALAETRRDGDELVVHVR